MTLRKPYTVLWALWVAAFLVIEGAAVLDPASGDTLSEHVRYLIGMWPVLGIATGGGLAWLAWHWLAPRG